MQTQKVQEVSTEQVKAIQSIANEIPGSLDLFEYMSARIRGRQDFSFKRVIRVMREHGRNITKEQLQTICEKLQAVGVGRIEYGKNGKDNRFIVAFHLISIAKAAKGEIAELDPVGKHKVVLPHLALVKTPEEQKATELQPASVDHKKPRMILVRCGAFEMELPLNMTAEERESASDLIASIPQVYQN